VSRIAAHSRLSRYSRPSWVILFCLACLAAAAVLAAAETGQKGPATAKPSGTQKAPLQKPAAVKARAARSGQEIFHQQCAECHGASGEGSAEHFPRPLTGDRSLNQLAAYIEKSMPEDDPGTCVGEDAKSVAGYVYDSFYSPAARARNMPARVELSRLTVNQYANAVADLIGGFRWHGSQENTPGLNAKYTSRHRKGDQVHDDSPVEQIDAKIDFTFGAEGPLKGKIKPEEYLIHWHGLLFVPETGDYEFNLETSNGARLFLNDNNRPLVDAWVRSGAKAEHRETIHLLGGRKYLLRIDFSKGKNEPSHIALKWKLPQGAEEVVAPEFLSSGDMPEIFILQTPFPPDDRSMGYERGSTISKEWERAVTDAAVEVAGYVGAHFRELSGVQEESLGHDAKTRKFCEQFVERAFRRPLTERDRAVYIDHRFKNAPDLETAVRRVVMLALASPRFLYVSNGGDAFNAAARLSLTLWDSLPDQRLHEAAARRAATPEQLRAQARRMLADPRARAKLRLFFLQWLKVDAPPDLAKDPKDYGAFDAATATDLRTSLLMFLDDVMWSEASDFRQLIKADYVYMNGRLANYYRQKLPPGADFQKVIFEPEQRAGILSHPYLMAAFAHAAATSPIHRGLFIARGVLGLTLRPPPEAIAPLSPDLQPSLTTRERVEMQTRPEACQSCHATINPLGFALERFDASGRLRHTEKGRPIDAQGSYLTREGKLVKFNGARDLAQFLASSEEVRQAFVERMFQNLVKQPIRAYGPKTLPDLTRKFAENDYNMKALVVEIAVTAAK
jgi:mono/diheme cytochrome c family protein